MPIYEYFCEACQKEFEKILSLHEHDEVKIVCPNCGTNNVHQVMTPFFAVTSKKS
jgi:putative FmdB family regulatory protein